MDIHWVDVFATGPLSGNPLAVVTGDHLPSTGRMQALAAEIGLSETVFAVPGDMPRLRIFTPAAEIPLVGHPLVGAAWVLARMGWIGAEGLLATAGGDIPVRADAEGATMTRAAPRDRGHEDPAVMAALLGGPVTGTCPIWDAGLPQVLAEVDSLDDLAPDHAAIAARGGSMGWAGVSAFVLHDDGDGTARAEVRHFADPIGIREDPVTGSAAGALGAALLARGGPAADGLGLTIRQGRHVGRDGLIAVTVDAGAHGPAAVHVGGAVVPVMTGTIGPEALRG